MQTETYTEKDFERMAKLHASFANSDQLKTMFSGRDAYVDHMLKAEYDSDPTVSAEFPSAESFAAYAKRAVRNG